MRANNRWQKRFSSPFSCEVQCGVSGDNVSKSVQLSFFDPVVNKSFRVRMSAEEAREVAERLMKMADYTQSNA
jgi:hypothetical protein